MDDFYILLLLLATVFWIWQFLSLMALPESSFKGRYDKLIWAIALIFLTVLGLSFFCFGNSANEEKY